MWRKNFIYGITYANNNPMRFTDPTGYDGFDDVYLGPGMQAWVHPEQDGPGGGSGGGGGGGGDITSTTYLLAEVNIKAFGPWWDNFWSNSYLSYNSKDWYRENNDPYLIWGGSAGNNVGGMFGTLSVSGTRKYWQNMTMGGGGFGSTGGGFSSGLDYTNNIVNTGAFVASEIGGSMRLMKSGSLSLKYYASAWNGGSRAAITTYNLTKWGSKIGQWTSIVTAGLGTVNFMLSNKSWGDYGKLGISYLSAGLTYFPEPITTGIGIGIGFIDAAGGFDGFYDYLDINQQLYISTGGIILPMNGIPQFIPLK